MAIVGECVATVPSTWWVLLTLKLFIVGAVRGVWQEPRVALASACFLRARTLRAILAHPEPALLVHRRTLVRNSVRSDLLCAGGVYVRAYVAWEIAGVLIGGGIMGAPLAVAVYAGRASATPPSVAVTDEDVADYNARECRACAPWIRACCCWKRSTP